RGHLVRGVLSRHAPSAADNSELSTRMQLISNLKVPQKWVRLAQAHRAKYENLPNIEADHLAAAGQWNAAHNILIEQLLPTVVLSDDLKSVASLLELLNEAASRDEVSEWESGGLALYHYMHVCEERPALILLTKAYRSTSSVALPVLAGVLPADLEVTRAGRLGDAREPAVTIEELRSAKLRVTESVNAEWQRRWDTSEQGRELYRFFPEVEARLKFTWVEPDYETSQLLTGHGCFRGRLHRMKLAEVGSCYCGEGEVEDAYHALWECELYREARRELLDSVKVLEVGPVYYRDLVGSEANFRQLRDFARRWHRIRSGLERGEERRQGEVKKVRAVEAIPSVSPAASACITKKVRQAMGGWWDLSPDLSPLDYKIWQHLEEKTCSKPHPNL
ncbi:hypothetical protein evm_015156, partial [Chilo suppressalis]